MTKMGIIPTTVLNLPPTRGRPLVTINDEKSNNKYHTYSKSKQLTAYLQVMKPRPCV